MDGISEHLVSVFDGYVPYVDGVLGLVGQFVFVDIDRVVLDAGEVDGIDPGIVNEFGDVSGASTVAYDTEAEKDRDEMGDSLFNSVSEFLMVSVRWWPLSSASSNSRRAKTHLSSTAT